MLFRSQEQHEGLDSAKVLSEIATNIALKKKKVNGYLNSREKPIVYIGYGAPAKAVTFISEMGLQGIGIKGIIDDNKWKQNKFLPVSGIQITSKDYTIRSLVEPNQTSDFSFVIFPWNLGGDMLLNLKNWAPSKSKVISFFPDLEVTVL